MSNQEPLDSVQLRWHLEHWKSRYTLLQAEYQMRCQALLTECKNLRDAIQNYRRYSEEYDKECLAQLTNASGRKG